MDKLQKNLWLLLSLLWFIVIVYSLFFYNPNFEKTVELSFLKQFINKLKIEHIDKLYHSFLFFVQFWLISKFYSSKKIKIPVFYLVVLGVFLSVSTEGIQHYFMFDRQGDILDALANMLGVNTAILVVVSRDKYYKDR